VYTKTVITLTNDYCITAENVISYCAQYRQLMLLSWRNVHSTSWRHSNSLKIRTVL